MEMKLNDVYCIDFQEGMKQISENSIEAIITDPPYTRDGMSLWEELSKEASRVLKPSGFLVAYHGNLFLPQAVECLGRHLNYYWMFCLKHNSSTGIMYCRKIRVQWKPVLVYQKAPIKRMNHISPDYIDTDKREKRDHIWQQGFNGIARFVEMFSKPGDSILDPFAGSGTTLVACKMLKRNYLGFEIDNHHVQTCKERIQKISSVDDWI
jgi:DNA modification methylase